MLTTFRCRKRGSNNAVSRMNSPPSTDTETKRANRIGALAELISCCALFLLSRSPLKFRRVRCFGYGYIFTRVSVEF